MESREGACDAVGRVPLEGQARIVDDADGARRTDDQVVGQALQGHLLDVGQRGSGQAQDAEGQQAADGAVAHTRPGGARRGGGTHGLLQVGGHGELGEPFECGDDGEPVESAVEPAGMRWDERGQLRRVLDQERAGPVP